MRKPADWRTAVHTMAWALHLDFRPVRIPYSFPPHQLHPLQGLHWTRFVKPLHGWRGAWADGSAGGHAGVTLVFMSDFSSAVEAQSRILSHALPRGRTRQLAYMPSSGPNASVVNKGASAGSAVSHCMHASRNRGRDLFRIQNRSSHPIADNGFTSMLGHESSSIVDSRFHLPVLSFVDLCPCRC